MSSESKHDIITLTSKDKLFSVYSNNCFDVYVEEKTLSPCKIKISNIKIKLDSSRKNNYGKHYLTISGMGTYFQREITISPGNEVLDYWNLEDLEERSSNYTGGVLTVTLYNSTRNIPHISSNWSVTLKISN